ncbi:MAG TPA: DUF2306 domain-containing protein [Pseudonocardiaceae bacterium]
MLPLALLVGAFLLISLPRYAGLDPGATPVRLDPGFPLHYPFLVGHVLFGSIALVTVCLQVWPRLRERHPAVHRWSGRVYVFAGMLPSTVLALAITPFGHGEVGNAAAALLWLVTTSVGYRHIRLGRVVEHRRWMIYSFALSLQIVWGRFLLLTLTATGQDLTDPAVQAFFFETASWIGFVINLLIAQWWLERTARRGVPYATPTATPPRHRPARVIAHRATRRYS